MNFGFLNATLDLAHVLQVVVQADTIRSADLCLQRACFLKDRVEDAAIFASACLPLCRTSGATEHAFERRAGIDLHRQALRFRCPCNRVHVRAAIAGNASADITGKVFGRKFERRERRVLSDVLRENLIDTDAHANVFRFRLLCQSAGEPARRTHRMIGGILSARTREVTDQRHLITEGFQRFENRLDLKRPVGGLRSPVVHHATVGQIDGAETERRFCLGLCERRHGRSHRFQERQSNGSAHAAQKCSPWQRLFSDDHS
jgi:hypothetical protein